MTISDPAQLIHSPPGAIGSGRVRYGAAMALYHEGRLSEAQLEVYREAAAHDARDPAAVLAERGLPPIDPRPAAAVLEELLEAAIDYLLHLHHPGEAEVRRGLSVRPEPTAMQSPIPNSVVEQWLPAALAAIDPKHQLLAQAIAAAAALLRWVTYDAYPRKEIGEAFATSHAFASILGEDAPFAAKDFDLGLFLIAPHTLYRDHQHAAPELYAPLTGPHGWRFGPGTALTVKPAHTPVWNPPFRPHLTKVGPVPFLALFVWTRDVNETAAVLPAEDWSTLEELRLG